VFSENLKHHECTHEVYLRIVNFSKGTRCEQKQGNGYTRYTLPVFTTIIVLTNKLHKRICPKTYLKYLRSIYIDEEARTNRTKCGEYSMAVLGGRTNRRLVGFESCVHQRIMYNLIIIRII